MRQVLTAIIATACGFAQICGPAFVTTPVDSRQATRIARRRVGKLKPHGVAAAGKRGTWVRFALSAALWLHTLWLYPVGDGFQS